MNKNRFCLLLFFVLICLSHSLQAISQNKEEFDNLIFYIPQGLSVSKTPNNMVLTDVSSGAQNFTITINKSTFSLKKIEKNFPVFWRESLLNEGIDNPAAEPVFVKARNNSGWNCFRGGKPVQYSAQSPSFYYHLTVMQYLGLTVRIITRAGSEEVFMQKIPLLMQLVSSVNFKTQPPPQNQNTNHPVSSNQNYPAQQTGTGNTSHNQPVRLNGLYMSVQGDLFSNAELSVLHFSPDGSVYTDIPEKGFFNLNMQDQRMQYPSLFGSFTMMNNTISVRMNNQSNTTTYTIEQDGNIKASANPAQLFKKIEALNNYQFEGIFINRQSGTNASIAFTRDGQFTDNGLIKTILTGNQTPSSGNGTYSSRQNSLLLQYSDGRQLQLCFYVMPEDFQKGGRPDKVLINNYVLVKQ